MTTPPGTQWALGGARINPGTVSADTARQESGAGFSRLQALFQAIGAVRAEIKETAVICIPWMQIKHPLVRAQEEFLEGKEPGGGWTAPRALAESLPALAYSLYLCARLLQIRSSWSGPLRRLEGKRFDLIAKSWSVGGAAPDPGRDFYLGDLQAKLGAKGVSLLILSGDPNGRSWEMRPDPGGGPRLCELAVAPVWAPLAALARQWRASRHLRALAASAQEPLVRRVAGRASVDVLSRRITHNLLYEWVGSASTALYRPKGWLSLYEGNGWEQAIWKGVKAADPGCRTLGYQHTILLRHNLSLLEKEGWRFNIRPDAVLCLGPRTRALLEPSHPNTRCIPFGSFRSSPSAPAAGPRPEKRTILVVPEGYAWEAKTLFECAIRTARLLPDWRFILRCHPVLPFERVRGLLEESPERQMNVEISRERSLQEEMERSSALLYRGSSVVLYAVSAGLKPFYLDPPGEREVDPLFELNEWKGHSPGELYRPPQSVSATPYRMWKERVSSPEELADALQASAAAAPSEWQGAAAYVRDYAAPVTSESVEQLLEAADLRGRENP